MWEEEKELAHELNIAFYSKFWNTLPQSAVQLLHSRLFFCLIWFQHLREINTVKQDFHIYISFYIMNESKAIQISHFRIWLNTAETWLTLEWHKVLFVTESLLWIWACCAEQKAKLKQMDICYFFKRKALERNSWPYIAFQTRPLSAQIFTKKCSDHAFSKNRPAYSRAPLFNTGLLHSTSSHCSYLTTF